MAFLSPDVLCMATQVQLRAMKQFLLGGLCGIMWVGELSLGGNRVRVRGLQPAVVCSAPGLIQVEDEIVLWARFL
jgi:hypothetical protein